MLQSNYFIRFIFVIEIWSSTSQCILVQKGVFQLSFKKENQESQPWVLKINSPDASRLNSWAEHKDKHASSSTSSLPASSCWWQEWVVTLTSSILDSKNILGLLYSLVQTERVAFFHNWRKHLWASTLTASTHILV